MKCFYSITSAKRFGSWRNGHTRLGRGGIGTALQQHGILSTPGPASCGPLLRCSPTMLHLRFAPLRTTVTPVLSMTLLSLLTDPKQTQLLQNLQGSPKTVRVGSSVRDMTQRPLSMSVLCSSQRFP